MPDPTWTCVHGYAVCESCAFRAGLLRAAEIVGSMESMQVHRDVQRQGETALCRAKKKIRAEAEKWKKP